MNFIFDTNYRYDKGMTNKIFTYSAFEFQEIIQDALKSAKSLGATDAAVEVSEGHGLSVSVRRGEVETIERSVDKSLGISIFIGQQRGNASTSDFSSDSLRGLFRQPTTLPAILPQIHFRDLQKKTY